MKFLCAECGNYTYFECDIQVHQSVRSTKEGIIVEDATFDDFNWSDSNIREGLEDSVGYALKQSADVLQYNPDTGHYENTRITCARCGSKRVTPPYSKWSPKNYKSVYKEPTEKVKRKFEMQFEVLNALTAPATHPVFRILVRPKQ